MSKTLPKIYSVLEVSSTGYINHGINYITDKGNLDFIRNELSNKGVVKRVTEQAIVYIAKNSQTPRFKLKKYFYENRLRKTKLPALAEVILMNKKDTDAFLSTLVTNKKYFLPIEYCSKITSFKVKEDLAARMVSAEEPIGGIIFEKQALKLIGDISEIVEKNMVKISSYGKNKFKQTFENLFEIAYNKSALIIYDENVLEQINEGGHVIDDDAFETLSLMLKSSDIENIKVGLEILANSNYTESYVETAMILSSFYSNISEHTNAWSQNFKSLLLYLDSNKINYKNGWKSLARDLLSKGGNEEKVREFIIKNLNLENKEFKWNITDIEII